MEQRTRPIPTSTSLARPATRRRELEYDGLSWIDIPQPVSADITYLRERLRLDPLALDDVLSTIQRPKLDVHTEQEYLFLVVHVPTLDRDQHVISSEIDVFVGADFVVTCHDNSMKPLRRLFAAAGGDEQARRQLMARGPGFLLYRILEALTKQSFATTFHIDESLERLRGRVLNQDAHSLGEAQTLLEQDVLALRHAVQPNAVIAERLRQADLPFLRLDTGRFFGDIADGAAKLADIATQQQEQLVIVGASLARLSVQQQAAAQSRLLLAMLPLLPFVLLAAISVLALAVPPVEQPLIFGAALLVTLTLCGGLVWYGRKQRWF